MKIFQTEVELQLSEYYEVFSLELTSIVYMPLRKTHSENINDNTNTLDLRTLDTNYDYGTAP